MTSLNIGSHLETRCAWTKGPTDMTTYRAAIAAKNSQDTSHILNNIQLIYLQNWFNTFIMSTISVFLIENLPQ